MAPIIVNCEKLPFGRTLGVSHYLIQLCTALSEECELIFAIPDITEFTNSPARPAIEAAASDILSFDEARNKPVFHGNEFIELLPHHFQEPKLASKSTMICHDLYVYDVGWKYKEVDKIRKVFNANILNADAVITHFPRTYYSLERIAGITKDSLFLTESPLLLDTRRSMSGRDKFEDTRKKVPELIYPAQLQEHKNHKALILAAAALRERGQKVRIICPGTSFAEPFTEKLKALAKDKGVEKDIEFVGRLSDNDLCELYWHCDGVIVPSLAEGGAYVALEAIAAGKPVAVNRIDSAQQHIKAVAGEVIWFDATDIDSTVRAISRLISADEGEWVKANAVARERIDQMTWEGVAQKWFAVFRWLSGETERPWVYVDRDGWNIDVKSL